MPAIAVSASWEAAGAIKAWRRVLLEGDIGWRGIFCRGGGGQLRAVLLLFYMAQVTRGTSALARSPASRCGALPASRCVKTCMGLWGSYLGRRGWSGLLCSRQE